MGQNKPGRNSERQESNKLLSLEGKRQQKELQTLVSLILFALNGLQERVDSAGVRVNGDMAPYQKDKAAPLSVVKVVIICVISRLYLLINGATGGGKSMIAATILGALSEKTATIACTGDLSDAIFERLIVNPDGKLIPVPTEAATGKIVSLDEINRTLPPATPTLKKVTNLDPSIAAKWLVSTANPVGMGHYNTQQLDRAVASSHLAISSDLFTSPADRRALLRNRNLLSMKDLVAKTLKVVWEGVETDLLDALMAAGPEVLAQTGFTPEADLMLAILHENACVKMLKKPEQPGSQCTDCSCNSSCGSVGWIADKQIIGLAAAASAYAFCEYAQGHRTDLLVTFNDLRLFFPLVLTTGTVSIKRGNAQTDCDAVLGFFDRLGESTQKFWTSFGDILAELHADPNYIIPQEAANALDSFARTENPSVPAGVLNCLREPIARFEF